MYGLDMLLVRWLPDTHAGSDRRQGGPTVLVHCPGGHCTRPDGARTMHPSVRHGVMANFQFRSRIFTSLQLVHTYEYKQVLYNLSTSIEARCRGVHSRRSRHLSTRPHPLDSRDPQATFGPYSPPRPDRPILARALANSTRRLSTPQHRCITRTSRLGPSSRLVASPRCNIQWQQN
jgi:hypothetical protein